MQETLRDIDSIPGLGRSPGEGNSNPIQYSCLENPMDRGAWRAIVSEATQNWTRLSDWAHTQREACGLIIFGYWTSLVSQMVKCLPTMRETWVRSLGQEDPLEKEMATHSSSLAWKTPWTEEPGRLQSIGLQRVGHDWATSLHFIGISSFMQSYSFAKSPAHWEYISFFYTDFHKKAKEVFLLQGP